MKKILLLSLCSIIFNTYAYADFLNMPTYYPSPFGAYDRLQLVPRADLAVGDCMAMTEGMVYLKASESSLRLCSEDPPGSTNYAWSPLIGVWTETVTSAVPPETIITPKSTNPNIFVGVGTTNPQNTLHVVGNGLMIENDEAAIIFNDITGRDYRLYTNENGAAPDSLTLGEYDLSTGVTSDLYYITSTGNVGIGVIPSRGILEISDVNKSVYLDVDQVYIEDDAGALIDMYRTGDTTRWGLGATGVDFGIWTAPTAGPWDIPERLHIDPNGNVGIANNNPQAILHVKDAEDIIFEMNNSSVDLVMYPLTAFDTNGFDINVATSTVFFKTTNDTSGPIINWKKRMHIDYFTGNIGIRGFVAGYTDQAVLTVLNTNLGSGISDILVEGEGLISIIEPPSATNASSYLLFVDPDLGDNDWQVGVNSDEFNFRETESGLPGTNNAEVNKLGEVLARNDFCIMGGGCSASFSDQRLKKNLEPLNGSLDKFMQLRPVTFEWKDRPLSAGLLDGRQTGLIAQEVERVVPEWVYERDDGYKAFNFNGFEAMTIQAIQELKQEIDTLKKGSEQLSQRVLTLEGSE